MLNVDKMRYNATECDDLLRKVYVLYCDHVLKNAAQVNENFIHNDIFRSAVISLL